VVACVTSNKSVDGCRSQREKVDSLHLLPLKESKGLPATTVWTGEVSRSQGAITGTRVPPDEHELKFPLSGQRGGAISCAGQRLTLWRLSARRQPSASARRQPSAEAAWLAESRFPTRLYCYGSTALPFFLLYSGSPGGDSSRASPRPVPLATERPSLAPRGSRPLSQFADRAVWPQRSGGQVASLGIGSGSETTVASCDAIRGPDQRAWNSRCLLDHGCLRT